MPRSEHYNTKQKDLILDIIKKQKKEFTIKDIYSEINNKTGLTTVYRLVDKLVENKVLNKTVGKDGKIIYQYLETCENANHFYLKCDICGTIEHVDCDCINDLATHILKKHRFVTSKKNIIISGICKSCN